MNYNNSLENDSTTTMRVVCAVAFVTFSFVFLFFRQADVMAVAQHVLSGGMTVYYPFVGATLITLVLFLLQHGINSVLHINHRMHWTTFFPSMLLLAFITDISPEVDRHFSIGAWAWAGPLLLAVWTLAGMTLRKIQKYEADIHSRGLFSRLMWVNLFPMGLMMMLVGIVSANDDTFHYKAKMERMMKDGEYDKAATVGEKSLVKDISLTMLRCYALAREGRMADEMFKYPVCGTSETLLPTKNGSRMMMYPVDSLYRFLGAKPYGEMTTGQYLKALEASGYESKAVADYRLCGMLVDRNIDAFVRELPRYYHVNDSLPLHYKEALTLYTHKRSAPLIIYKNQIMDTDFDDMQKLVEANKDADERRLAVFNQYFGTYWWYYEYGK